MFTALAMAMALMGPIDDAEAPAGASAPTITSGFVMIGAFKEPGNMQFGFADMSTYRRTGNLVDIWENWMPYRAIPTSRGTVAYYRRRFTFDCVARTDAMTEIKSFSADGQLLRGDVVDNPPNEPINPGTVGVPTLAFLCEGAEPAYGRMQYATWDKAAEAARKIGDANFKDLDQAEPGSESNAPKHR